MAITRQATVGFIGLGNVGLKLAANLVRHNVKTIVCDLVKKNAQPLLEAGAIWQADVKKIALDCDVIITCLPHPSISAKVMKAMLVNLSSGQVWLEMSTTDADEVRQLANLLAKKGVDSLDCPVSGGCHRAATGNIAIFAGGSRDVFEKVLPLLQLMGGDILHTGELGSASILKVATNYLATANLLSICEAFVTMKKAGMDLATTYEAFRLSSGTSFVLETEGQVILNGSRDISFTMDLVSKDIGLFQKIAQQAGVTLELNPKMIEIFKDGAQRFGARAFSPNIIKRFEQDLGIEVLADGFPATMTDNKPEHLGQEVKTR